MANIFTLEKIDDFTEQINIDELYEYKKNNDLNKLALFQKILNRVHVRIKTTSRQKKNENFCWYIIPEIMIGVPKYDQGECIAYIMDKLKENGFLVRYFHPNTVLISWQHWVPSYVRDEIKKKTGIVINEYGEKQSDGKQSDGKQSDGKQSDTETQNPDKQIVSVQNNIVLNTKENVNKTSKQFTPIQSYKPSGNLVHL